MRFGTTACLVLVLTCLSTFKNAEGYWHLLRNRDNSSTPAQKAALPIEPLVQITDSETEPFRWSENAEPILIDYRQSHEEMAQLAIDVGDWSRAVGEFSGTQATQAAVAKLETAGLRVLSDGRIIPKGVYVGYAGPYTR